MHHAHGMSYAEYEGSLEKRLSVEKARERDHYACARIKAEYDHRARNH